MPLSGYPLLNHAPETAIRPRGAKQQHLAALRARRAVPPEIIPVASLPFFLNISEIYTSVVGL
jgi:hypothetical protein